MVVVPKSRSAASAAGPLKGATAGGPPKAASASATSTVREAGTEFDAVLTLAEDELTSRQYDRQVAMLNQLLQTYAAGFPIRAGLHGVPEVLRLCGDRVAEGHAEFLSPLLQILEVCAYPFLPTKAQDNLQMGACMLNVSDTVVGLLTIPNERVRLRTMETLTEMVTRTRSLEPDDLSSPFDRTADLGSTQASSQMKKGSFSSITALRSPDSPKATLSGKASGIQHAIQHSRLVPLLVAELCQIGRGISADMQAAVVRALRGASRYATCCRVIAEQGGMAQLFNLLAENSFTDYQVFLALEVIWNVLELHPPAIALVTEYHHVSTLYDLARESIIHGFKLKDKELRNDIITVCTLIAQEPDSHAHFFRSGFTELLFIVGAGSELKLQHKALMQYSQSIADEDFELKKLVWNLLYTLSFHSENAGYLRSCGFIQALMQYLDVDCGVAEVVRWPTVQVLDLQFLALHTATELAVMGPQPFVEADGPRIILTFLQQSMDLSLRNAALRCLVHLATSENRAAIIDAGAIGNMIDLAGEEIDFGVKRDCLEVMSYLCAGDGPDQDRARLQFGDDGGVELLLPLLELDPGNAVTQSLMAAAVECVRHCVLNGVNEARFLEQKGIHKLLDILERCPDWLLLSLLTCLVDGFDSPEALAQAQSWSHRTLHISIEKLLIQLWPKAGGGVTDPDKAKAVAALQAASEAQGVIPFVMKPGHTEYAPGHPRFSPLLAYTVAALDGSTVDEPLAVRAKLIQGTDAKAKVFCLLSHLGLDMDAKLNYDERVVLAEIRNYRDVRKDRMWEYVEMALQAEGCRPTTSDGRTLEQHAQARSQRREKLTAAQDFWRVKDSELQAEADRTFYQSLLKKADDPEILSRSLNCGMTITQAKIRKSDMLKASFEESQRLAEQHRALDSFSMPASSCPPTERQPSPKMMSGSWGDLDSPSRPTRKAPSSAPSGEKLAAQPVALVSPAQRCATPQSAPAGDLPPPTSTPLDFDSLDAFAVLEVGMEKQSPALQAFADRTSAKRGLTEGEKFLTETEFAIQTALRALRSDPQAFIPKLLALRAAAVAEAEARFGGRPAEVQERFDAAVARLREQGPAKRIKVIPVGLTYAARDLALALGFRGLLAPPSPSAEPALAANSRALRYGMLHDAVGFHGEAADVVALGRRGPEDILCEMLLDPGQLDTLLGSDYRYAGVGTAWHRSQQYICVITLVTKVYREKAITIQASLHERFSHAVLKSVDGTVRPTDEQEGV
eukprot:EG_transcript_696